MLALPSSARLSGRAELGGGVDQLAAPVQAHVLDEEHRIVVGECRPEQVIGVLRVGRHHDLDPGNVHEPGFETLGMLRAAAEPRRDRRSQEQRYLQAPAAHVVELCRLVVDLIHADADEVEELDLDDRPHTADREADTKADGARLAERSVTHHLGAEPLPEPASDTERAAVGAQILPEVNDRARLPRALPAGPD